MINSEKQGNNGCRTPYANKFIGNEIHISYDVDSVAVEKKILYQGGSLNSQSLLASMLERIISRHLSTG